MLICITFQDDMYLVVENALTYNKPDTVFYRAALRIQNEARIILADLEHLRNNNVDVAMKKTKMGTPCSAISNPPWIFYGSSCHPTAIKDDLNMELDVEPASSLFSYEFAKVKPPPPYEPSPLPSPIKLRVRYPNPTTLKRDRKQENGYELTNDDAHVLVPHDLPAPDFTEAHVDEVPHVLASRSTGECRTGAGQTRQVAGSGVASPAR